VTPQRRILLCSSQSESEQLIAKHLGTGNFHVERVGPDSIDQPAALLADQPDLLILMSEPEGATAAIEIIKAIRLVKDSVAIVHLIQDSHYRIRVESLKAGSDESLSFPFALEELDARIESLLRRCGMGVNHLDGAQISHADLVLNTDTREVTRADVTEKLTVKEYDLLTFFLQNPNQAMARKAILHSVWGQTWTGDDNLLEVYIRYLRKKIERPGHDKLLQTVRGVGYMLR
jgi:DNA-binding response OmpR family regulator